MRNPLVTTKKPAALPGSRVIENPTQVRVQFQRRRARQLIKLIGTGTEASWCCYVQPHHQVCEGARRLA